MKATRHMGEKTHAGLQPLSMGVDMSVCPACLSELFDANDRRYLYPYISCADCGPQYTVTERVPAHRSHTTLKKWPMCPSCTDEYEDMSGRRFHVPTISCPECGPHYRLHWQGEMFRENAIERAAQLLRDGQIVAIKGLGGYHLACDAENEQAVHMLRQRKRRKAKPFALMVCDMETARTLVHLSPEEANALSSRSRPVVLAQARRSLPEVAPDNGDLGVMLPYTPLHYLLFYFGAPPVLVMTSANRSGEPMVYNDGDALTSLIDVCDAWLIGSRPIARRVDDSVIRVGAFGTTVIRRGRGMVPLPVANLPTSRPLLAVGADLKNSVTLVVKGKAVMSQPLGDLAQYEALTTFKHTIREWLSMHDIPLDKTTVVSDLHPDYHSTRFARELAAHSHVAVQHHRAHVASVLAERNALDTRVVGVAFDGTGYGDDGTIWGGELFVGSVVEGLERCGHLRHALLPGGDAASRMPLHALAGFLSDSLTLGTDVGKRLDFPDRYFTALQLVEKKLRTFPTTSVGRFFDAVAALLGFTEAISFEGQAAIWLEHLARSAPLENVYPFPWDDDTGELDYVPLIEAIVDDRLRGREIGTIARTFHRSLAEGIFTSTVALAEAHRIDTVVLTGGVFQNALLFTDLKALYANHSLHVWTAQAIPSNDGGISLGQAALVASSRHR